MSESSENFLGFFNNKNLQDKEKEVANQLSQLMNTPSLLISPQIIVNKLSPIMEQKKEYKPKPRRLTLISTSECDFCENSMKKDENGNYIIKENGDYIIHDLFGFIECINCNKQKKAENRALEWYKEKKVVDWRVVLRKLEDNHPLKEKTFSLKRSSGLVETDWELDTNEFIRISKKDNPGEFVLPLHKYGKMIKYVFLEELCDLNKKLNYQELKDLISSFVKN
jgi:hypothetical protein